MTWADSATLPADELTAFNADKPFLVGNNILERAAEPGRWTASNNWEAGDDITFSGAPTRLAYDRRARSQTLPTLAEIGTSESVSLIFSIDNSAEVGGAHGSDLGEVDTVAIINHNFWRIPYIDMVYVDISNDGGFPSGPDTISLATWDTFTVERLVATSLSNGEVGNQRLWNIALIRILITLKAGHTFSFAPRIGEAILGRRQQLTTKPQEPIAEDPLTSESATLRSESGEMTRHALYSGAGDRSRTFLVGGVSIGDLNPEQSVRNWFRHTGFGQKSFLYLESPLEDPKAHLMLLDKPALSIVADGPVMKSTEISMVELPPFVSSEVT